MNSENMNNSIEIYLNSDYEKFEKYERYQFLIKEMSSVLQKSSSLLDIGCAKGELIYLLQKRYNNIDYWGIEYSQELVNLANKNLKNVNIIQGNARNFYLNKRFDIIVMSRLLSIFDDVEEILQNCINHLKKWILFHFWWI